jgi:hypothetical protein
MLHSRRSIAFAVPRPSSSVWLLALACSGCLVDADEPCSENEVVLKADFAGCVCADGAILNAERNGCTRCGENERVLDGACACADGYARSTIGGACTAASLGSPCSASAPCAGDYPYCAAGGYCTRSGCAASAECPASYACELGQTPPYCSRPPAGQGASCDPSRNSADCTGEADYCAMGSCVVSGCATTKSCHGDWVCCDFSAFGLKDLCVATSALASGLCPGTNAAPVTR